MSAVATLARLRAAGVRFTLRADGTAGMVAPVPPPPDLLAEARAHRDGILALLAARMPDPDAPCPTCRGGLWWRASVYSGGPGPWCCARCEPAPADVWQAACAVPEG